MQTVLVAGGAGFIGSHLCEKLLQENFSVICIDNLLTSDKKNIESFLPNPNFKFIEEDITQPLLTTNYQLPTINYIFHLASPASPNLNSPRSYMSYPIETLQVNSVGTKNLLDLALDQHAKFLYASTSEVYGDPAVSPQQESYFGNVNPNGIRSVYDEGKRFGEAITMAYYRKYGVDIRIMRIFNTYGPNMLADDGRVVSNFIVAALQNKPLSVYGEGSQTRSFCYVSDLVDGLYAAMFSDKTKAEVINLGNPIEKTIKEFAMLIKDLTKTSSEITYETLPDDDPKQRKPDITKAKQLLGWEPKVGLEEGLQKTLEYFKNI
ncbi:MAG TPA: UDP-glucuronic acid decarboxylase family protein [Candidatus Saccharimonadales bacterium]|nr:UDP-glucuronic acid decarboxylase family protein [Candidatus Saccharimonadales bacterium]